MIVELLQRTVEKAWGFEKKQIEKVYKESETIEQFIQNLLILVPDFLDDLDTAMEYLSQNDPSLRLSLKLVKDRENIDSLVLAQTLFWSKVERELKFQLMPYEDIYNECKKEDLAYA